MKVHCYNILLFSLLLNTLLLSSSQVNIEMNHYNTPHIKNAEPTESYRSLCECEIYTSIYDNDPEMKEVMENYNRQTSKRFEEYNERMNKNRQKCKEQCDRDIQNIILKDKLEKQMAQQLTTLETKINTEDIPTCVCEKSVADKVEKFCLNCGVNVGGGVTLSSGVLGGIGAVAVNAWKPKALEAAIAAAKEAAAADILAAAEAAGNTRGIQIVIHYLETWGVDNFCPELFQSIGTTTRYYDAAKIIDAIIAKKGELCSVGSRGKEAICQTFEIKFGLSDANGGPLGLPAKDAIPLKIKGLVGKATEAAEAKAAEVTAAKIEIIETAQEKAIETTFMVNQTSIIASIVAIVVIILVMLIIYLVLRYRRKKKMKKKLQYIKLLEE
ncbi:rifin PIR protein, putative [Plasmodium reichenowi]|uniref:Rifin PIR protein, putative n=1 Tax=Plasmodium reichenowi TaxID=5854 RepID=A0A2P9DT77_PLARE|nr:rifin PIR protein, putative [Plasmodium reichenowi]